MQVRAVRQVFRSGTMKTLIHCYSYPELNTVNHVQPVQVICLILACIRDNTSSCIYRIIFKIATLMYHILHNWCPTYLVDLVAFNTADSHRSQLRLSHTRAAIVKRTRTQFGKRAFSACGPNIWNSLPPAVIQHLDELWSHIYSSVLFWHKFLSLMFTIDYCNAQSVFSVCMTGHYNTFCHYHYLAYNSLAKTVERKTSCRQSWRIPCALRVRKAYITDAHEFSNVVTWLSAHWQLTTDGRFDSEGFDAADAFNVGQSWRWSIATYWI